MPLSGTVVICRLGLATVNLYTKFEIYMFTHYEDTIHKVKQM